MSGLKWSRRTTQKVAEQLALLNIHVSSKTVCRLLKSMGYSLRTNRKSISHTESPQRNEQFEYISRLREQYASKGQPIISVDTKKKELVGQFKNAGKSWECEPVDVNDHDFRSQAIGMAVPYGIYELLRNRGTVYVGTNKDTSELATDAIAKWWRTANKDYTDKHRLLILADGGGSNSARGKAWKAFVQTQLADRFNLEVTVCHYPPGTSKWNPIEHRLFSEISKNWSGKPLDSYDTILNYIRTTRTASGLKVRAKLLRKVYKTGITITKEVFAGLSLQRHDTLPQWNYTLKPRQHV